MQYQNQKQTPQKLPSLSSTKKSIFDQSFTKQLLCPFIQTLTLTQNTSQTPLKKQPQYLLSPSPLKKDLFSQLLASQTKHSSPPSQLKNSPIQQQNIYISQYSSQSTSSMQQQSNQSNSANWSDQDAIKKRKRKSTTQIKLLKQQLNGQINWTKQKIIKMATITGLSQSQVYKWCWDQKKKQIKQHSQSSKYTLDKKKYHKKHPHPFQHHFQSNHQQNQLYLQPVNHKIMTKIKTVNVINNHDCKETEKRVNKKLVFF